MWYKLIKQCLLKRKDKYMKKMIILNTLLAITMLASGFSEANAKITEGDIAVFRGLGEFAEDVDRYATCKESNEDCFGEGAWLGINTTGNILYGTYCLFDPWNCK